MAIDIEETEPTYDDEKEKVKESLDIDSWKSTPDLAKDSHLGNHKWKYWRYQLMPGILQYFEKEGDVEKDKRPEGGEKTHYWRLK